MEHQTFWKPEKQVKEKKSYSSLHQQKTKAKKEVPEWKKGILAHHQKGQSSKDRCEFDTDVLAEVIAEQGEICPCCKIAQSTTTHHVWPRGRKGRGVKSNALRVCWPCHDKIQTTDELLQYWISVYREKYGDHFWFDEKDWEEFNHKQNVLQQKEREKQDRQNQIKPVVDLLTAAAGRSLKANEIRLLQSFEDKDMQIFTTMMADALGAIQEPTPVYSYGERFED
ncbi:HNH endonuclease [Paenibacillus sp. VTT E-133280]|uniref:HNH endonuclease signature motif containing protein n=1 Tax=Paenibacillus sp. VTT E-133280 TaxID=1986222 RepID=UPI000BA01B7C|nr:HNH endonuclease signature motif containing protein [Paenibacillus sp. VTT E-133280]OZQ66097.1 HNH endonuclease [Paenibacillus sp. VTT E-133280]